MSVLLIAFCANISTLGFILKTVHICGGTVTVRTQLVLLTLDNGHRLVNHE